MTQKILMATHQYGAGGVGVVAKALHDRLEAKGLKVDVLTKGWNEPYRLKKSDGTETVATSFTELEQKTDFNYDLCHVHSINFSWEGALQVLREKKPELPIYYTAHSIVRHQREIHKKEGNMPGWIDQDVKAQDHVMSIADKVQLFTNEGKSIAEKYYPANEYNVIPNGVTPVKIEINPERIRARYSQMDDMLLYIGRLSDAKGLKELMRAFPRLHRQHEQKTGKKLGLVVVGPEQDLTINELTELLPSRERKYVEFTGQLSREEAAAHYHAADLHLLPTKHESFPGVVLEAMNTGLPSICTKVDGLKEVITDRINGLHIDPDNLEQGIFESVSYALENPDEMKEIARVAKEGVKQYDWDKIAEKTIKEYNLTIKKRKKAFKPETSPPMIPRNAKIGITGHFAYRSGRWPDGVANWCEGAREYLKDQGFEVKGIGIVGDTRPEDNLEVVQMDALEDAIKNSCVDVMIIRGAEKVAHAALDACEKYGIRSVWVQPFWGVWRGVYDIINRADITIVPTPEYAEILSAHTGKTFGKDIRPVPFPIRADKWPLSDEEFDPNKVAYAGRIKPGAHRLIPIFAKAAEQFSDAMLYIYGATAPDVPEEEERIAELIKAHNLENRIIRESRPLSSQEMLETFRTSAAYLFPTIETYGQSNLEAMLTGVPVVTYKPIPFGKETYSCPSMSWFPEYPFAGLDDEELSEKLTQILSDPALARKRVKEHSEKVRNEHSWRTQGKQILAALANALV